MQRKVLIANRGEIAVRIAQAAAGLGLESVAVYSSVDAHSLHTSVATESHPIAGGPVAAYLDAAALIDAARQTGCDCVHPGYGFLSESAAFAEICAGAELDFIGPPPSALRLFGDKTMARDLAQSLGIPIVGGSSALTSAEEAAPVADKLGYPVMLKAAAGGGGRGMRAVLAEDELAEAFDRCRSEALAAFGDGTLFLERLIHRPRHIEVQILADAHGHVVHLHERDCSVQLRNQKVVEVAPAPGLDGEVRERILADAVKLVRAAEHVNAGTVEFLVAPETGEHFFIECNPRVQVEHTVTEQITGIDIVEAQFRIAAGASLDSLGIGDQTAVGRPRGYAVQARVVAGGGTITGYKEPSGPGVRVDASGYLGYAPPPQFDPLLAKVIGTSGLVPSFASAVDRTLRALDEFQIEGVPTNLPQLRAILASPVFRDGEARTSWLAEGTPVAHDAGATIAFLSQQAATVVSSSASPVAAEPELGPGERAVTSPMASALVEFRVAVGDAVDAGDGVLVVSAMKMETEVVAPCAGVVTSVAALAPGDSVAAGAVVAVIEEGRTGSRTATRSQPEAETWAPVLDDVRALQRLAHQRFAPG